LKRFILLTASNLLGTIAARIRYLQINSPPRDDPGSLIPGSLIPHPHSSPISRFTTQCSRAATAQTTKSQLGTASNSPLPGCALESQIVWSISTLGGGRIHNRLVSCILPRLRLGVVILATITSLTHPSSLITTQLQRPLQLCCPYQCPLHHQSNFSPSSL
jgi:hypothetical protein